MRSFIFKMAFANKSHSSFCDYSPEQLIDLRFTIFLRNKFTKVVANPFYTLNWYYYLWQQKDPFVLSYIQNDVFLQMPVSYMNNTLNS